MVRGSLKRFNLKDDWRVIRINDTWLFGRNLSKISQQQWESFCCLQSLLCLAVAFWRALDKQLYPQGSINVVSLISAQPYLMDATDVPECLVAGDKNTHTHKKLNFTVGLVWRSVCVRRNSQWGSQLHLTVQHKSKRHIYEKWLSSSDPVWTLVH